MIALADMGPFADLGATAAIVVAFLFLVRWLAINVTKAIAELCMRVDAMTITLLTLQKQLIAHDLTVTGINPSAGETVGERAAGALKKYAEIQEALSSQIKALEVIRVSQ